MYYNLYLYKTFPSAIKYQSTLKVKCSTPIMEFNLLAFTSYGNSSHLSFILYKMIAGRYCDTFKVVSQ